MGILDFNVKIRGDTVENFHKTKAAILLLRTQGEDKITIDWFGS
jgi:hypothetical protein